MTQTRAALLAAALALPTAADAFRPEMARGLCYAQADKMIRDDGGAGARPVERLHLEREGSGWRVMGRVGTEAAAEGDLFVSCLVDDAGVMTDSYYVRADE